MSKSIKYSLYLAAALAVMASPILWRSLATRYKVHAASNPQPVTVQQHNEITGPNVGKAAILELRTVAVRSDGSRVDVTREPRKGWITREISFANGTVQTVYDDVKTVSTSQVSSAEMQNHWKTLPDPQASCAAPINGVKPPHPSVVKGTEVRLGIPVVRIFTGSNLTVWMAPSLGCLALEHSVDWDSSHPGTNLSELKVDTVTLGDPDPALFSIQPTYTEMLPSQAQALHLRFASVPDTAVQKMVAQTTTTADQFYLSHRPTALGK